METELKWYALRVMSRYEPMVKKHLIYRGHQAYTKLERRFGKWINGKRTDKEYVAAPSYVFLGTTGNPWAEVHNCHMIRSVVSYNGKPAQLHPKGLSDFLGFDDFNLPDYFRHFRYMEAAFKVGDMVNIDNPSFEGFELRVRDIQRGEAIFSLVMMGRETELRLPVDQCSKAA
jgi:transcription antitermination factor NusG